MEDERQIFPFVREIIAICWVVHTAFMEEEDKLLLLKFGMCVLNLIQEDNMESEVAQAMRKPRKP